MTASEAIDELIASDFIPPNPQGYNLAIKGGKALNLSETFLEADVKDNDTIRIIPATEAGGGIEYSSIPGLKKRTSDNFTITDIQNSPEAVIMIVNLYDDLQARYEKQTKELEKERRKADSRLIATLLLLVSQVIFSIGANLLTSNQSIAIPVLIAGGIQALLAVFFTFRQPKS